MKPTEFGFARTKYFPIGQFSMLTGASISIIRKIKRNDFYFENLIVIPPVCSYSHSHFKNQIQL